MKRYVHDSFTNTSYNKAFPLNNTPQDDPECFLCFFWDADNNFSDSDRMSMFSRTVESTNDYFPIAKMRLRHLPTIGMYLNFNNVLYMIEAVCIVGREQSAYKQPVVYDIEVKRVYKEEEKII